MIKNSLDHLTEERATRRSIVKTGVKLSYAVPVVAASFKLSSTSASAVSPTCKAGTCAEPEVCGQQCACREADNSTYCLQQLRCSSALVCDTTAECPAGYVCLPTSCCIDKKNRCVPVCNDQARLRAQTIDDGQGLVLGNLGS